MPLTPIAWEWEGVKKGSKSENLPLKLDFATCGKREAHQMILPAPKRRHLLQNQVYLLTF